MALDLINALRRSCFFRSSYLTPKGIIFAFHRLRGSPASPPIVVIFGRIIHRQKWISRFSGRHARSNGLPRAWGIDRGHRWVIFGSGRSADFAHTRLLPSSGEGGSLSALGSGHMENLEFALGSIIGRGFIEIDSIWTKAEKHLLFPPW